MSRSKIGLIDPAPYGTTVNPFNQSALLNLYGFSPSKAKEYLLPVIDYAEKDSRINGLFALLEYKLGHTESAFKYSEKAVEGANPPSWIWFNHSEMLMNLKDKTTDACKILYEQSTNYKEIFGQDEYFGGVIQTTEVAGEQWISDELLFMAHPDTEFAILNHGAVKTIGEIYIEHLCKAEKQPINYDFDPLDERTRIQIVSQGEAVLPVPVIEKLGGDKFVNSTIMAGRARLASGKFLEWDLIKSTLLPYNDTWLKDQLIDVNNTKTKLLEWCFYDKLYDEIIGDIRKELEYNFDHEDNTQDNQYD